LDDDSSVMTLAALPPDDARALAADPTFVERDLRLVCEAIALVASGAAPRVIVANIRYGSVVLDAARQLALADGVRIRPLWRLDMEADLAVEPIAP
jgi:hypothetical protein